MAVSAVSRSQYIGDWLDQPSHLALSKLQKMLLAFQGETTVIKFIGC